MTGNLVRLNVRETLVFFDEKPDWSKQQATAIVGVIGEDLAAAALRHCLEANGASNITVRIEPVTTGMRRGPQLDRWIEADLRGGCRVLFQTEIKNWSAHAIGGKTLGVDASPEEVGAYKEDRWGTQWDAERRTLKWPYVAKVLVPMKVPFDDGGRDILPLLIFWTAMGPGDQQDATDRVEGGHLFSISGPTVTFGFAVPPTWPELPGFRELWVFSVSSYLRSINQAAIELEMPQAAARLRSLDRLVQLSGE